MNCQKHLTFFYLYNKLTNKHTGAVANSSTIVRKIKKKNNTHKFALTIATDRCRSMTQQMFQIMALLAVNMVLL